MSKTDKAWECVNCGVQLPDDELVLASAQCKCGVGAGVWQVGDKRGAKIASSVPVSALVEEARRLDAEATKGEWRVGSVEKWHIYAPHPESLAGPVCGERVIARMNQHFPHDADARFIARARTLIPELVAALTRPTPHPALVEAVRAGIEAAADAVERERLDEPQRGTSDDGYEAALDDCVRSIRSLDPATIAASVPSPPSEPPVQSQPGAVEVAAERVTRLWADLSSQEMYGEHLRAGMAPSDFYDLDVAIQSLRDAVVTPAPTPESAKGTDQ